MLSQLVGVKQVIVSFAHVKCNILQFKFLAVAGLNDQLSYVELATVSNEECQLSFGALIHDTMLCAVGNYNEGNCLVRHNYLLV